ncbi:MAG: flagellar filament capping protein FliD [Myxococcota bacterium]
MGLRIGGITFSGISSGFPTDEIIEQLLELERRPVDALEARKASFEEKLAIFQDLNTRTLALRDALRKLDNMNLFGSDLSAEEEFRRFAATSSNSTIATATAAQDATPGSLVIEVQQLAAQERNISNGYSARTASVGTGTFSIQVGSDPTVDITIDSSNESVDGFVAAVNSANAGVTAFVVDDGGASNPFKIIIVGNDTGAAKSLTLTDTLSGGESPLVFNETQAAANARIVLDPDSASSLTIEDSTNTFSEFIRGLTLKVEKVSTERIAIEVEADPDLVADAIVELVSLYNDVIEVIAGQAEVDPNTNRGGPLIGDSTLIRLKQQLATVVASQIGSGSITSAVQIGLELGRDGKLTLDEEKLDAALASGFEGVAGFFAGADSFADKLRSVADSYVDIVDGALLARINGTTQSIENLTDSIRDAEDRLESIEESLVLQFAALERTIAGIQQQANFLNQFLLQTLR